MISVSHRVTDVNFQKIQWLNLIVYTIELLDWIEEYQLINLSRLWEAVSGEGWIQKWSHFQLDLLFSPRPCTKVIVKKEDGSHLFLHPAFLLYQMVSLLYYSAPALWFIYTYLMCDTSIEQISCSGMYYTLRFSCTAWSVQHERSILTVHTG